MRRVPTIRQLAKADWSADHEEMAKAVRAATRGRPKKKKKKRVRTPPALKVSRYVRVTSLASGLNVTLLKLSKQCRQMFSWWPNVTEKTLKKTSYRDLKSIVLSYEDACQVCEALDVEAQPLNVQIDPDENHIAELVVRPSVVSILGHVDHGKTTLMDRLRGDGRIAPYEPGGITQETYCFQVDIEGNNTTFLDTPGHRVFSNMRDNAAFLSDLAILMVDVNEGIQPQTLESIDFIAEHQIPILPVFSKVDDGLGDQKVQSRVDSLGEELSAAVGTSIAKFQGYPHDHMVEPLPISALTGYNMDTFLAKITSRLTGNQRRADLNMVPYGVVIEAFMEDGGRGKVITVVLWQGRLREGDHFASGMCSGQVKQMRTSDRTQMKEVEPGVPVQIMGLRMLPEPGDDFIVLPQDEAGALAEERQCEQLYPLQPRFGEESPDFGDDAVFRRLAQQTMKDKGIVSSESGSGADSHKDASPADVEEYDHEDEEYAENDHDDAPLGSAENPYLIVVKADKQGALQPLLAACEEPFKDEITGRETHVSIIQAGVGTVTKEDILIAEAAGASIQCFRVKSPSKQMAALIKKLGIEINIFDVYFDFLRNVGIRIE